MAEAPGEGGARRDLAARACREGGQASVELLAGVPALVLAGVVAFQLLAVGYSSSLAGDAAEAGAMAIVAGRAPEPAVRAALPGWARGRVELDRAGGALTVRLRPPSPFKAVADRLEVSSSAWVRSPGQAAGTWPSAGNGDIDGDSG